MWLQNLIFFFTLLPLLLLWVITYLPVSLCDVMLMMLLSLLVKETNDFPLHSFTLSSSTSPTSTPFLLLSFLSLQIDQDRRFSLFFYLSIPFSPTGQTLSVAVPLSIFSSILPTTSTHPPRLAPPLSLNTQVVKQQVVWCWIITWCMELPGESGAFQGFLSFFKSSFFWFAGPGELVEPGGFLHTERRGWAVGKHSAQMKWTVADQGRNIYTLNLSIRSPQRYCNWI